MSDNIISIAELVRNNSTIKPMAQTNKSTGSPSGYSNLIVQGQQKYTKRVELFKIAQLEMFSGLRQIYDDLNANNHDLTKSGAIGFDEAIRLVSRITIINKIFGDLWDKKSLRRIINEETFFDYDACRISERLFKPENLFCFYEYDSSDKQYYEKTLPKSALTYEEKKACFKRAQELYETFKISEQFYKNLKIKQNPHSNFIKDIAIVSAKLDHSVTLNAVHTGQALWYLKHKFEECKCLFIQKVGSDETAEITNCIYGIHRDVVKPGSFIRYVETERLPQGRVFGEIADILS